MKAKEASHNNRLTKHGGAYIFALEDLEIVIDVLDKKPKHGCG
jgi:hypothetical protein